MLMDEPFGAIDPITRGRLQNDFLRLRSEICKTIVFVTHDIDEAIKMGDRICILREGGRLAQYDTPATILADPADDFVAHFVGADRGLKRLALRRLEDVQLDRVPRTNGKAPPECSTGATLREALSLMLTDGSSGVVVRGSGGEAKGLRARRRGRAGDLRRAQLPRRRSLLLRRHVVAQDAQGVLRPQCRRGGRTRRARARARKTLGGPPVDELRRVAPARSRSTRSRTTARSRAVRPRSSVIAGWRHGVAPTGGELRGRRGRPDRAVRRSGVV